LRERRDKLAILIAELQDVESRLRELEATAIPPAAPRPGLKLGGLVEAFRNSPRRRDCSPEMLENYCGKITAFVEWAGADRDAASIGDADAEGYAAELGTRCAGGTYNKHLNALTMAWTALGRAAGLEGNPWQGLPRKRLEAHSKRVLTQTEIDAILGKAGGEWRKLILIGLRTGLRMGDAVRLDWLAFADGSVALKTRKTGAPVCIPAEKLHVELSEGRKHPRRGAILPHLAATYRRDPAAISSGVREIFERAGIKTQAKEKGWARARAEASFHSLRHTFVTRAIEAGVPAEIVRALVGHSRATTTEIYTHISNGAVLEAFSRAIEGKTQAPSKQ
jgi:integrase